MKIVLSLLNMVLITYVFLMMLRVFLSWMHYAKLEGKRSYIILFRITEPLLKIVRKIPILKKLKIDISPLIITLLFTSLISVVTPLIDVQDLTFRIVLFSFLAYILGFVLFFLILIDALLIIKLIMVAAKKSSISKAVLTIDAIIHPIMSKLNRKLFKGRIVQYQTSLIISISIFSVLSISGILLFQKLGAIAV